MPDLTVAVVGGGYVGIPTAVGLSNLGHAVSLYDRDEERIRTLQDGLCPIYEPHLADLMALASPVAYSTSLRAVLENAQFIFIAVGTPSLANGETDLGFFDDAVQDLMVAFRHDRQPRTIVIKSTVPVGTADRLKERLAGEGFPEVQVVSNPEFLRQGSAVRDALFPDRVVVGGEGRALENVRALYTPLITQTFATLEALPRPPHPEQVRYIETDNRSAELAKYAANAFLAMKISFVNEIANICDALGGDVGEIAQIMGADPRIGPEFLNAGLGFGGSCFLKDTRSLRHMAHSAEYQFQLLAAVSEVNDGQPLRLLKKAERRLGSLRGKRVAVLGMAFKPNTDDIRESPGVHLARELARRGAEVVVHDPQALGNVRSLSEPGVQCESEVYTCVRDAHLLILATEWAEYLELDFRRIRATMPGTLVLDGRNCLSPAQVQDAGLSYVGMGREAGGTVRRFEPRIR